MSEHDIRDEREKNRFVTEVDGETAVLRYSIEEDRIRFTHTEVPESIEGRGVGSSLARHALDSARDDGLRVWPECPFVASYIQRHPEYLDVVDPDYPRRDELETETD